MKLHRLELLDDPIQAVLHIVCEIVIGFSSLLRSVGEHLAHILKREFVSFASLESLCPPNQRFYVVILVLEHVAAVTDGSIKVGELFVASGTVCITFESNLSAWFACEA